MSKSGIAKAIPRYKTQVLLPLGGKRGGRDARPSTDSGLLSVNEVSTAVLLPATFVRLGAERFLFAHGHGLDAIAAHSSLDERILHRAGAIGAEGEVIFGRAALVAVSFDGDADVGMLLQELGIGLQRSVLRRAYIGLVVVEVDILDILREEFLFGGVRGRCWRRRRCEVDGHASRGILGSAGALGDEMVGGRVGR